MRSSSGTAGCTGSFNSAPGSRVSTPSAIRYWVGSRGFAQAVTARSVSANWCVELVRRSSMPMATPKSAAAPESSRRFPAPVFRDSTSRTWVSFVSFTTDACTRSPPLRVIASAKSLRLPPP